MLNSPEKSGEYSQLVFRRDVGYAMRWAHLHNRLHAVRCGTAPNPSTRRFCVCWKAQDEHDSALELHCLSHKKSEYERAFMAVGFFGYIDDTLIGNARLDSASGFFLVLHSLWFFEFPPLNVQHGTLRAFPWLSASDILSLFCIPFVSYVET